ncbi:MAG: ABC transporter permease [Opitutales bacterium]|nr:ABC transporter permease [Opitutales bacterium]MCH8539443.1 ABC transporter permease [Opitutales bacterium]
MSSSVKMPKNKVPWFAVRQDLSGRRQSLLALLSFALPIGLWCLVSYVPSIWHPDVRLHISAEREGSSTVYTPGNHLGKDHFQRFVQTIREQNLEIQRYWRGEQEVTEPPRMVRRSNQRVLRQIGRFAVANGWLERDERQDDEKLFEIWRGLAEGELRGREQRLTEENLEILRANWAWLEEMETFSAAALPAIPLQQLLPQGRPANPVFLPNPHDVVLSWWDLFSEEPTGEGKTLRERLGYSLRIVFSGFLLSCLIGLPLGVLCGTYNLFSRLFEPFVDFFRYMPAPVFSTLLVAIFGAHDAPKIALIFVGTFFQMVLVIAKTTRLLDRSLLEAAQTLGAKNRHLVLKVIVPGVMPNVYNDLRILLGWAWTWLVIAELIGVKAGLTEFIETQGRWRNFDLVFPVIITIGLIGFATDQLLAFLRRFLFPWEPKGYRLSLNWLTEGHRKE